MKNNGHLLADLRRRKNLTQEELAENSGVTVRTIQRIEAGQVVPQPHTLRKIAACLEVQPDALLMQDETGEEDEAPTAAVNWGLLASIHIAPLVGIYLPLVNILIPLVFWLVKKEISAVYDEQGRKIINFQATMTIVCAASIVIMLLFMPVGYPLLLLSYLYAIAMALTNAVKAMKKQPCRYPLSIPFLKSATR